MLAKNEGVTGKISEVEHFEYMHPLCPNSKIKVQQRGYEIYT